MVSLGTSGTAYAAMTERAVDPSGLIAGFADATGGFLPLAATLNCTLAVDRFADWLGIEREAVADSTEATVLPYLDGERTPNLPRAAGTITGLRHDTTREQILLAAYEGAAASLIEALELLDTMGSGLSAGAPVVLIGGGARGAAWQRTVARLAGRAVQVPQAEELVALGAAAQAAACVSGEPPEQIARRWDARRGSDRGPAGGGRHAHAGSHPCRARRRAADLLDADLRSPSGGPAASRPRTAPRSPARPAPAAPPGERTS